MHKLTQVEEDLISKWKSSNTNLDDIQKELLEKGFNSEMISAFLQEYNSKLAVNKQVKGFIFIGVGAFLGFLSCIITLLSSSTGMYSYTLYGLTLIALTLIFIGLYFVFE